MTACLILLADGFYNEATGDSDPGWAVLIGVLFFPVLLAVGIIYWRLKAAKENEEAIGKLQKRVIELENSNTPIPRISESQRQTAQSKQIKYSDYRVVDSSPDSTETSVRPTPKLTKKTHDGLIKAVRKLMENQEICESRPPMSLEDLAHKLTRKYHSIQEAEQEHMITNLELGDQPVPFGFSNNRWRELLSEMEIGDELWTFTTSEKSWDNGYPQHHQ